MNRFRGAGPGGAGWDRVGPGGAEWDGAPKAGGYGDGWLKMALILLSCWPRWKTSESSKWLGRLLSNARCNWNGSTRFDPIERREIGNRSGIESAGFHVPDEWNTSSRCAIKMKRSTINWVAAAGSRAGIDPLRLHLCLLFGQRFSNKAGGVHWQPIKKQLNDVISINCELLADPRGAVDWDPARGFEAEAPARSSPARMEYYLLLNHFWHLFVDYV